MVMWWAPLIQMLLSYLRHLSEGNAFYFLKTLSHNHDLLCIWEQFKLPWLAKCLCSIIIAYTNNKVILPLYFFLILRCFPYYYILEHFQQQQSSLLYENSLSI